MNAKLIQSKINRVKAEMLQLSDRSFFTEQQEQAKLPALQAKLDQLEKSLAGYVTNLDVTL
jgi:hypothetical protein